VKEIACRVRAGEPRSLGEVQVATSARKCRLSRLLAARRETSGAKRASVCRQCGWRITPTRLQRSKFHAMFTVCLRCQKQYCSRHARAEVACRAVRYGATGILAVGW